MSITVTLCQSSAQTTLRLKHSCSQTSSPERPKRRKRVTWTRISPLDLGLTLDDSMKCSEPSLQLMDIATFAGPFSDVATFSGLPTDVSKCFGPSLHEDHDFDEFCCAADDFEWRMDSNRSRVGCHVRKKKKWSKVKTRVAVKTLHLQDLSVGLSNRGQRLFIKARIYNKLKERLEEKQEASKAAHLPAARPNKEPPSTTPPPVPNTRTVKPRSAPAVVKMAPHQLVVDNVPTEMDNAVANLLITLQHREITPEDYDLLLRLDESVAPKTVSSDVVTAFRTRTVEPDAAGALCPICLQEEEIGAVLKVLPCDHAFHADCIDRWLTFNSRNCPLDGLPVDS